MQGCMSSMIGNQPVKLCVGLQQLKEEHPPLLDMLETLLNISENVETFENSEKEFNQLIQSVNEFILGLDPHSEREEGVLFPMMAAYIGKEMGPIAVMEYEHDQAKSLIGEFIKQTKKDIKFTREEQIKLASLIKQANYILVEHFSKEENVLFPMAESMLSEEEKEELLTKINVIR
ncbi:hemerythrin domain-containing protein [Bacillus sp. 31A1R]|uniref:Hemerythrin domain-containing protein n=1 Tax=Robertmurraya mangrovi TaxID=3098077 RepID=A0ABU5ITT3_9BACI|nr:hemerythrin domain-containing protein [Bacillus sp. 31A1R]MDZ5470549.1 hemerythrin domain-containing protein [Bacillus sp. 31A1R]